MTYSERPMHFISGLPRSASTLLPSVLFRLDRKDGASTEMAGSRSREKTDLKLRSSVFRTLSSKLQADSPLRAFENWLVVDEVALPGEIRRSEKQVLTPLLRTPAALADLLAE